jgi:AraC family transcriptional regulator
LHQSWNKEATTEESMSGKVETARRMMRDSIGQALTMQQVAEAVGMSPFAFSRLFTATNGMGPLAYLRRLRLEAAATQLVSQPDKPIVDIAFDVGFESQQTFTRAFTGAFGLSPGRFRRKGQMKEHIMTTSPLPQVHLDWRIDRAPGRCLVGFEVVIDASGTANPGDAWRLLDAQLPIPGQVQGTSYGVCFPEEPDGTHRYMAAVELAPGAPLPAGMQSVQISAGDYLIARQHMPVEAFGEHLQAGLERLWSEILPASGRAAGPEPDLEVYADELIAYERAGVLTYLIPLGGPA